jgi:hypothetical protein
MTRAAVGPLGGDAQLRWNLATASSPGIAVDGIRARAKATAFAALSPLL